MRHVLYTLYVLFHLTSGPPGRVYLSPGSQRRYGALATAGQVDGAGEDGNCFLNASGAPSDGSPI